MKIKTELRLLQEIPLLKSNNNNGVFIIVWNAMPSNCGDTV